MPCYFRQPKYENTKQRKTIVNLEDAMRSIVSMTMAACAIAVVSSSAFTQAPAPAAPTAPPSAGGTPDAMPFDIPYGVSIGLERAK
jgi:glc operon protein GlcG